jgi:hypothetical protein
MPARGLLDLIDLLVNPQTSNATDERDNPTGNPNPSGHFITRFINRIDGNDHFSTSPDLIRHTQAELENESEYFHTPPSSPLAELDGSNVSDVFVTPPPSSATTGTGPVTSGMRPSIPTPPCTTLRIPIGPRLPDVFTAQVPVIPVSNVDPGRVPMTSAALGLAPAGPSVT